MPEDHPTRFRGPGQREESPPVKDSKAEKDTDSGKERTRSKGSASQSLSGYVPMDIGAHPENMDCESESNEKQEKEGKAAAEEDKPLNLFASFSGAREQNSPTNSLDILKNFNQLALDKLKKFIERSKNRNNNDRALVDLARPLSEQLTTISRIPVERITFENPLLSYQREGVAWMLSLAQAGLGGILASEPGLGKTLQAIEFMRQMQKMDPKKRPCLIVVPKSILEQWKEELILRFYQAQKNHLISLLGCWNGLGQEDKSNVIASLEHLLFFHQRELTALNLKREEYIKENSQEDRLPADIKKTNGFIHLLESKQKRLLERHQEILDLMDQGIKIPDFHQSLTAKWDRDKQSNQLENSQQQGHLRNLWVTKFLGLQNVQKLKAELDNVLRPLGNVLRAQPLIFRELKVALQSSAPINLSAIQNILDRMVNTVSVISYPVGVRALGEVIKKLAPNVSVSTQLGKGQVVKSDITLLKSDPFEQVLVLTSDRINTKEKAKAFINALKSPSTASNSRFVLTSAGSLSINASKKTKTSSANSKPSSTKPKLEVIKAMKETSWLTVIGDEAHEFGWNMSAQADKKKEAIGFNLEFLKELKQRHQSHIMLLTGTPYVNWYGETLSLLQLANPHLVLAPYATELNKKVNKFGSTVKKYGEALDEDRETLEDKLVSHFRSAFVALEHAKSLHGNLILIHESTNEAVRLAWTRADGQLLLPNKICHTGFCNFTAEQNKVIAAYRSYSGRGRAMILNDVDLKTSFHPSMVALKDVKRKDLKAQINKFSLEQVESYIRESDLLVKLFSRDEHLHKAVNEKRAIIIAVPMIHQGTVLKELLKKKYPEARVMFYYGEKTTEKRNRIVNEFQESKDRATILILSADAGGVGLNLPMCEVFINLAKWWNYAMTLQLEARAIRPGKPGNKHFISYEYPTIQSAYMQHIVKAKLLAQKYLFSCKTEISEKVNSILEFFKLECFKRNQHVTEEELKQIQELYEVQFAVIRKIITSKSIQPLVSRLNTVTRPCLPVAALAAPVQPLTSVSPLSLNFGAGSASVAQVKKVQKVQKPQGLRFSMDTSEDKLNEGGSGSGSGSGNISVSILQSTSKPLATLAPGATRKRKDRDDEKEGRTVKEDGDQPRAATSRRLEVNPAKISIPTPPRKTPPPERKFFFKGFKFSFVPLLGIFNRDQARERAVNLYTRKPDQIEGFITHITKVNDADWNNLWNSPETFLTTPSGSDAHFKLWQQVHLERASVTTNYNIEIFRLLGGSLQLMETKASPGANRTIRLMESTMVDGLQRYDILVK